MSFLGTKKFPSEGDFTDYLSSHGGSSNAVILNYIFYKDLFIEIFHSVYSE